MRVVDVMPVIIMVLDEVIGLVTTVPDAGITPLIGMGIGIGSTTVIGTVVIGALRLRMRPKSPVRVGVLTTV